ncbi:MAG: penicillin acylase family protein [Trueperaceae bacterium]
MIRAVRGPLFVLVVIVLLLAGLWLWTRTSLPKAEGAITLPGLAQRVEIARDAHGVPHILAESQEDVYYALGFVHAQDRLWQMEYARLKASGRLAELLGEDALDSDTIVRTLGLRRAAGRDLELLTPRTRGVLQAYSDGINAFLGWRSGALPPEFLLLGHSPGEWSPEDSLTLLKMYLWERSPAWREELFRARLAAGLSGEDLALLISDDEVTDFSLPVHGEIYAQLPLASLQKHLASNSAIAPYSRAWVVSGEHTVSGSPLLAEEGRGLHTAPAPRYLVELQSPGLNVSGATVPGIPAVLSGRNEQLAWALAPASADTQDFYVERVVGARAGNPGERYVTPGGSREFSSRQELIRVRGGDNVEITVRETRNGPVFSDLVALSDLPSTAGGMTGAGRYVLSFSWTALQEGDRSLQGALDLAFAEDWPQFRDALRNLHELGGAVLYAHVAGDIGRQTAGRLPERESGDGTLPVPGWSDRFEWSGMRPFGTLASEFAPASGRIIALPNEAAAGRVEELLGTLSRHTPESFAQLLDQQHDPLAAMFLPVARNALPQNELARRAQAQLLGWQGEAVHDSVAPLLFSAWYQAFVRSLLADELGYELAGLASSHPDIVQAALSPEGEWCDNRGTATVEDCRDIASEALSEAADYLAQRLGAQPGEWRMSEQPPVDYRHPVFERSLLAPLFRVGPRSGTTPPPQAEWMKELSLEQGAPVYRAVYDLSDRANGDGHAIGSSRYLIPTGQSGNPMSPHFGDLAQRWREGQLIPLRPRAEGDGRSLLTLEPRR